MPGFGPATNTRRIVSTTPVSVTGTTTNTLLGTATLPASWLAPGSLIRVSALLSANNNANLKTPQVLLSEAGNGLSAADYFFNAGLGSWGSLHLEAVVLVQATGQQLAGIINSGGGVGSVSASNVTLYKNAAAGLDVLFAVALANAADYAVLEGYSVEVVR